VLLPLEQAAVPLGPLVPGTRYAFTRDSLLWSSSITLADILARIPGVYVARAGFVGQPSYVQFAGRGGAALEVFWDGMPWEALGGDTAFVDLGQFPLAYLRRVEVEVLPARLRVYLVSERHEGTDVRSKVDIASGSFKTAQYTALFQKRLQSGLALDLAGHFKGTDGPNQQASSDAFDIWAKLGWTPNDRIGASYQLRRQELNRVALAGTTGGGVPAREGTRTDFLLKMFAATRGDGLGLRAEAGIASSSWTGDSGSALEDQHLRQAHLVLQYRSPRWGAELWGRAADARTRLAARARAGWVPIRGLVLSGEAGWQQHSLDRESKWVRGSAGVYLGPISVSGELALTDALQAPAITADTAVVTNDRAAWVGLKLKPFGGQVGIVRRDAYAPLPYLELPAIPALAPSQLATYLVSEAYLRPVSALTVSGWYSDPVSGAGADLQPPKHVRVALTLRSKFWRTFRSGIFDFKLQAATESWSGSTAGLASDGTPITLPGATFWEFHVEIQLGSFTAFWSLRNARLSDAQFVPGLDYPGSSQLFGASWVFSN
jgi:hypothetical protein